MIKQLEIHCREFLLGLQTSDAAHNIDHIERVVKLAKYLGKQEGGQIEVVVPAAWLHDCVSLPKNHPQRSLVSSLAADKAIDFLGSIAYPAEYLDEIHHAIEAHSYSADIKPSSLEAKIVQDADRIDALGAIGISRCIQVGTSLQRPLYHRDDPMCESREPDDKQFTIDHFYSKLLLIEDTVHTKAAKREAQKRSNFMLSFLGQLSNEIGGK
ncbi:HD domain-containing protein [Agarivorans sp. Alg241-V36]|uniref:HD domain-containing protein n=1 Tax=Agarivorans sp. Alg241-V36 TaxID=2305992 RepID=UPI0013D2D13D|nr:HD domain-containing protein [Agarivorans sp. Alg241-V36]